MKKILTLFLIFVGLLVLDNSLMPFFGIRGAYPSLLYIFVVSYSLILGSTEGVWVGAFSGMFQDLFFPDAFGVNALINMVACLIAGFVGKSIFKQKKMIPVLSCLLLTLFKGFVLMGYFMLFKHHTNYYVVIYTGVYNMIICFISYKFIYKLSQKDYMRREWHFKKD